MTQIHQTELIRLRPLQFSLRRVMIATTVMAILFLVLGPELRHLPTQLVVMVIGMWVVALAIFGGVLAVGSIYFKGVLRRAGAIHCVLPRAGHRLQATLFVIADGVQLLLAIYATAVLLFLFGAIRDTYGPATLERSHWRELGLIALLLWTIAFSVSGSILYLLRSRYGALCEHGLIHVAMLIPWRRVRAAQWRETADGAQLILRGRLWRWKFDVTAEHRAEVEQVLAGVGVSSGTLRSGDSRVKKPAV